MDCAWKAVKGITRWSSKRPAGANDSAGGRPQHSGRDESSGNTNRIPRSSPGSLILPKSITKRGLSKFEHMEQVESLKQTKFGCCGQVGHNKRSYLFSHMNKQTFRQLVYSFNITLINKVGVEKGCEYKEKGCKCKNLREGFEFKKKGCEYSNSLHIWPTMPASVKAHQVWSTAWWCVTYGVRENMDPRRGVRATG